MKKKRNLGIDLVNLKLSRNSRRLGFLCECVKEVFSPNVLKNMFIMLLSEMHSNSNPI